MFGTDFMESFSYEQIKNLFFNKFFNYVTGKQEDHIIEEMSVKDGIYTITAKFFPLCQALEEQDGSNHNIAKAVLNSSIFDYYLSASQVSKNAPWEAIEDELKNIRVKVELKLDGKYIKYIRDCMENPDMPVNSEISREQVFFYLQFDDVNEISEKDSVGWQAINSY